MFAFERYSAIDVGKGYAGRSGLIEWR
jgi:hypothetical protein